MGLLLVAMLMGAGAEVPSGPRPGVLHGRVTDVATNQPIRDVTVTARSPNLLGEQIVVTDAAGRFRFLALPSGFYTLSFEKEAFKPYSRSEVRVRAGRKLRFEVQLIAESYGERGYELETMCGSGIDVGSGTTGISVGEDFLRRVPVLGP